MVKVTFKTNSTNYAFVSEKNMLYLIVIINLIKLKN
jgi:hypothetical protein